MYDIYTSRMIDHCSTEDFNVLCKIFLGENIRDEGVLQRDIGDSEICIKLKNLGLIQESTWYNHELYHTTNKGSKIAFEIVGKKIKNLFNDPDYDKGLHRTDLIGIILSKLSENEEHLFPVHQPDYSTIYQKLLECEIFNREYDQIFTFFSEYGLFVKVHNYVSTRGGITRKKYWVTAPRALDILQSGYQEGLTEATEYLLLIYDVLINFYSWLEMSKYETGYFTRIKRIHNSGISKDELNHELMILNQEGIITRAENITGDNRPFEIIYGNRYLEYVDDNYLKNACNSVLTKSASFKNVQPTALTQETSIQLQDTITVSHNEPSTRIFIVHGHAEDIFNSAARVVDKLGLESVILKEEASRGRTIIEKFEDEASTAGFAIVCITPDDEGRQIGDEMLNRRARQNVILELGYFYAKLGRGKVVALYKSEKNFELPSDISGIIRLEYDRRGAWKNELVKELKAAGYQVTADNLP